MQPVSLALTLKLPLIKQINYINAAHYWYNVFPHMNSFFHHNKNVVMKKKKKQVIVADFLGFFFSLTHDFVTIYFSTLQNAFMQFHKNIAKRRLYYLLRRTLLGYTLTCGDTEYCQCTLCLLLLFDILRIMTVVLLKKKKKEK